MKKFLAALLAVVMVVSLVPATVFAAATSDECAVEKAFGTHSKAYCDLLDVDYTQTGETVEPKCGQDGYTMYKCECGAYFADDIIEMPDHEHAAGAKPVTERVEPTCSEYGMAAGYTCVNCGELYYEYEAGDKKATDKNAPAGAIAMAAHDWNSPSYPGADCTASVQICKVCGAKNNSHKPNKAHNFNYNDPFAIVKNSDTCEPGEAVFKCTNKGCEVEKKVPVDITGHTIETLEEVDAVEGTCTKPGVKAHYECEECGAKFLLQKDGSLKLVTDEEELKTAEGHSWGDEPTYSVLPTCETFGADYYFCELCGELKIENRVDPLGHTTYEEALAHDNDKEKVKKDGKWITVVKAESCTDQTTYTWACQKKCYCNADPADPEKEVCGYEGPLTTKKDAKKGHEKVTITVPATVEVPVTYKITLCTNENCDSAHIASKTWTKSGKTYTLSTEVKVVDGNVYELTEEELEGYHAIEVTGMTVKTVKTCGAHFYELDNEAVNKPATCTEKGYNIYFCNACNEEVVLTVAALGHNFDLEDGATIVGGDWICDASVKVECANGCGSTKTYKNGLGHVYGNKADREVKVPNCQESAGKYFTCIHCDNVKIENEVEYEYTPYFNTMKDAEAAHGELTEMKVVEGDCVKKGHIEYQCADCGFMIWVYDETTGKHLPPEGTPNYKEATCHHGKGLAAYTCERCDKKVAAEGEPLEHILTKVAAKKATCTTAGNKVYYTCSRDCCKVNVGTTAKPKYELIKYKQIENEDEDGEIFYTYEPYAGDEWEIAKLGHDYDNTTTVVSATCTTMGYTHEICANGCGTERVYDVVKATGHSKGDKVSEAPTCIADGLEGYLCKNANCFGPDKKAETADDGYHTYTAKPALGHVNAAGEKIENKCTDTVTDRVCVRCNDKKNPCNEACAADLKLNSKTKKYEVKKDHKEDVTELVPATCETPAYYLTICANECGKRDVEFVSDPIGHAFTWGDYAGVDYVNARYIEDMGAEFLENAKLFKETYGAEAIIAYTPATYETNGSITFKCANCDNKITLDVVKSGIDFTLSVDNAVKPGTSYTYDVNGEIDGITIIDGEVIAVDINMSAFETKVWGFNFEVEYLAASMNFLGYKFHAGDKFANYKVNNMLEDEKYYEDVNNDGSAELIYVVEDAYGVVKISAYTENALDGTMYDATVTGTEKVVTLYFQVEDIVEYTEFGVAGVDYVGFIGMALSEISVTSTEDEVDAYGDSFEASVEEMMDTNTNGNFNITDLQNCVKIIKGQADVEYLAACDVNKDGAVNLSDLDLMNKLLVGEVDAFEIYKALSWTAPEGFVAA